MAQWKRVLGATASFAITATALPTFAQAPDAAPITLGEIVVTAQKRSENLQEIPKQVQVVNDAALENANVTSLVDLVKLVPSMSGPNSNGMGGLISMRGVGTAAPSVGAAAEGRHRPRRRAAAVARPIRGEPARYRAGGSAARTSGHAGR